MTKRLWIALLTGLLTALPAASVSAGGHKWFHGHDDDGYETTWVEQTVTAYRTECKTQLVPVVVDKVVSKTIEEPYKYTELVPVTIPEKQTVTTYSTECKTQLVPVVVDKVVSKTIEEPYKYTELVPVTIPEKQTVTTY